jgi:hypothetical protein
MLFMQIIHVDQSVINFNRILYDPLSQQNSMVIGLPEIEMQRWQWSRRNRYLLVNTCMKFLVIERLAFIGKWLPSLHP